MRYAFSGHQTFPFRYTWLYKGVDLADNDPAAFVRDDGIVKLGVGKNMVASIRYWCEALGLIQLDGRFKRGRVLRLGELLFGSDGYDPYLEDVGTLWLLQWQLAKNPTPASTWYLAFTRWNRPVFARDDLAAWLLRIAADSGAKKVSTASIRRDVDVFLRAYVPPHDDSRRPKEESFDCPLVELGLISQIDSGLYAFRRGTQPTLPVEMLALAIDEFWKRTAAEQETLSFERVMFGAGSPGGAFQLSELGLATLLERLPSWTGLAYDESSGMRRLVRISTKDKTADVQGFLDRYYRQAVGVRAR